MRIPFFTLLLFTISSFAQFNYEKGYFKTNEGTLVACYIRDTNWNYMPTEIDYRLEENGEIMHKIISEIEGFGVYGTVEFKRYKVMIDLNSNEVRTMQKSSVPKLTEKQLLLKSIVSGSANLYSYSDPTLTRYFYETDTVPLEQLVYFRFLTDDGQMGTNSQFRQQLMRNVHTDAIPEKKLKKLKYQRKDLIDYFMKYNNSKVSPKNVESKLTLQQKNNVAQNASKTKPKNDQKISDILSLRIAVGAGNAKQTVIIPKSGFYLNTLTSASNRIYTFGAQFEFRPLKRKSFGFFVNPTYHSFKAEKDYIQDRMFFSDPKPHHLSVSYSSIAATTGIRFYIFINKVSKIFINAGYTIDLSNSGEINIDGFQQYSIGGGVGSNICGGFGYSYKNFSIECSLETTKNLINNIANYNKNGFVLAYDFL